MSEPWHTEVLENLIEEGSSITYGVVKPGPAPTNGVAFIRSGDIADGRINIDTLRTIGSDVSQQYKRTLLRGGELLVALVGQPGATAIAPHELVGANIARQVGLVRLAKDTDARFASYFLNSDEGRRRLFQQTIGSVQQVINLKDLKKVAMPVPPLPEQRKIAAILSSVDEAIEKTQVVIDRAQEVKKGLMQELLTKGLPGRHKTFKQTEIGRIPDAWKVVDLGDVLLGIDAGWSPRCASTPATSDEWGVLRVSAVSWGEFRESENKVLADGLEPRPEIEVRMGDLLMSRANTKGLVGRPVLVGQCRPHLMLSDKILRLRSDSSRVKNTFLLASLRTPHVRIQIENGATGSSKSMKNVSQGKLRRIRFALPGLDEQQDIADVFDGLNNRTEVEERSMSALQNLKSALMSTLLTGELRVRPSPEPA